MPFRVELVGIAGLPTGGTTGQVLTKKSGSDYDSDWVAASGDGDFKADGTVPMTADLNAGTHKIVGVVDPTSDQHAATKKYVDDEVGGVPIGDFLADGTVPMTADLNVGTHKIVGVVDPSSDQHAATKKYVDDTTHGYTAGTAGDWAGAAPTTITLALDRLAALVKILNSGTGA